MKERKVLKDAKSIQIGESYTMKACIRKIENDGNQDTRAPIILSLKIEESGSLIKIMSWDYDSLGEYKKLALSHAVCDVDFFVTEYKGSASIKLDSILGTKEIDEEEGNRSGPSEEIRKNITELCDKQILDKDLHAVTSLLLDDDFYKWPASNSIHHAYPGGLAEHTYGVAVLSIGMANLFQSEKGMKIDFDLLIAGALLHDIGKLSEYDSDGNISEEGKLLSHLVIGIEMIDAACLKLNIDSSSKKMMLLKHIIASHHAKKEFGSPVTPVIPEAYIISHADLSDSKLEIVAETLEDLDDGDESRVIKTLDDSKVLKV